MKRVLAAWLLISAAVLAPAHAQKFKFGECCVPVLGGCVARCPKAEGCTGDGDCVVLAARTEGTLGGLVPELGLAASYWEPGGDGGSAQGVGLHFDLGVAKGVGVRFSSTYQEGLDLDAGGDVKSDSRMLSLEAGPVFRLTASDSTDFYASVGGGYHLVSAGPGAETEQPGWYGLLGFQLRGQGRSGFFAEALYRDSGSFGATDLAGPALRAGLIWRAGSRRALDGPGDLAPISKPEPPDILPPQGEDPWVFSQLDPTAIHNTNTGNVGIGTREPKARLQVATGSDVRAGEGGFLMLGTVSGKNLGIDDNEILARDGGEPAPLTLQADGGDLVIHTFSTAEMSNVGIGVPEPKATLSIRSTRDATDDAPLSAFGILLQNPHNVEGSELGIGFRVSTNQDEDRSPGGALTFERTASESRGSLHFKTRNGTEPRNLKTRMTITSSGNVGIGTTSPDSALTVEGVVESAEGGIRFPDGTLQKTAQLKGDKGMTGAPGQKGEKGDKGDKGDLGPPGPGSDWVICTSNGGPCSCGSDTMVSAKVLYVVGETCQVVPANANPANPGCVGSNPNGDGGSCCLCRP